MLKEIEDDPTYSEEQRQLYRGTLHDLNTEKQASLEVLSQNQKYRRTQFARMKQTIEKVLGEDKLLAERICTLFRKQYIKMV